MSKQSSPIKPFTVELSAVASRRCRFAKVKVTIETDIPRSQTSYFELAVQALRKGSFEPVQSSEKEETLV